MSEEIGSQLVRAVIVNFNGSAATLSCVASLRSQHHRPLDIVVVDNASAASNLQRLRADLPRSVMLVRSERNLGYAGGINLGVRWSGLPPPQYILALNNDLLFPDPNMVTALIAALDGNHNRVAATPLVDTKEVCLPVEEQIQVRRVPGYWTVLVTGSWWLRRFPGLRRMDFLFTYGDHRPYRLNEVYECESINGSCFLVRTDFLEEIGYLDQRTFLYYEELVFGWMILASDRVAALTTATRVIHQQGQTTGHGSDRIRPAMLMHKMRSEVHYCRIYLGCGFAKILLLWFVRVVDNMTKMALQPIRKVARALAGACQ